MRATTIRRIALGGAVAGVAVAGVGRALGRASSSPTPTRHAGVAAGGMEYSKVGEGSRQMLTIPGGPGSSVTEGRLARLMPSGIEPYLDADFSVWTVTRRRHMPDGHTVADMADDYATFIEDTIGAPVDVVLGQSFGGMIALYLAANHPEVAARFVLAGSAARVSSWCADIDRRFAALQRQGRTSEAAATLLEYVLDVPQVAGARALTGRGVATLLARSATPLGDFTIETEAEASCDARDVLSRVGTPGLMVCGDADQFFPQDIVTETASALPDATLITYPNIGHLRLFTDPRLPRDVLAWLAAQGVVQG